MYHISYSSFSSLFCFSKGNQILLWASHMIQSMKPLTRLGFFHPHSMYLVCWCHIDLGPDPRVWPEFKDLTEPNLVICLQTLFNGQVLHSSLHLSTNVIHVFWETNRDIDLTIWYDPEISCISAIFFSFLSLCFASCSSLFLLIPTEISRFHNLNFHTHPIPLYLKYASDISKQLIFLHY